MTYSRLDADLFAADETELPAEVHVLMPCMAYACGETILTVDGSFVMGVHADQDWNAITCAGCRGYGREEIQTESRRQQGRQAVAS